MKEMNPLIVGIGLLVVGCLTSCIMVRAVSYDHSGLKARSQNTEVVILDSANSNRAFRVIGIVEANAGRKHDPQDTIEHLKEKARELGGDGILDINNRAINAARELWSAKVIAWTSEQESAEPAH
jgi:hypothetical protein